MKGIWLVGGYFYFVGWLNAIGLTLNAKEWTWISEKEGDSDLMTKSKASNIGVWQ